MNDKPMFYQCGCCEDYHRVDFFGDCRQDDERFDPYQLDAMYGVDGWMEITQADADNMMGIGEPDGEVDPFMSDAEADADALRNIGWGTDEDYGLFGDGDDY